jgi:hypothetical protein
MIKEIIAVYYDSRTKPVDTFCGQDAEFLNVKVGGTYIYHYVLKG